MTDTVTRDLEINEALVREIVDARRKDFPKEVTNFSVSFSTDHSGDPAVYVTFLVRVSNSPSKAKVLEFRRFSDLVESEILNKTAARWPYIQFVDTKK